MDNDWNDQIEYVVNEMKNNCHGYVWMNNRAARQTVLHYNSILFLIGILGFIVGTIYTIFIAYNRNREIEIISGIMAYMGSGLSALLKIGKFEQKTQSYKTISSEYLSLENNIKRQLSLNRVDRTNGKEYLRWVTDAYDNLYASAPLLPNFVYTEYAKIAEKQNLSVPKILERASISVVTRDITNIPLNQFNDNKMNYELNRFNEHKQGV
jgi:hypothetical protein